MSIEAMKQWLEALEDVGVLTNREWQAVHKNKANELRQAIAEAEKQEPVAWSVTRYGIHCNNVFSNNTLAEIELNRLDEKYGKEGRTLVPLYTTPQQRTWVGLTRDEIQDLLDFTDYYNYPQDLIVYTQAKLKDKNL